MAVFGASVAFEDSPLRARHSALSILRWITAAGDELEAKEAGFFEALTAGSTTVELLGLDASLVRRG